MPQGSVERRRGRRVTLEAPLLVRRLSAQAPEPFKAHTTKDIGLAGVYFETDAAGAFRVHDAVMTSISIPETQRRDFPYSRLAGRGRVVRVSEVAPAEGAGGRARVGVALEFSDDLTALTATPSRT